MTALIKHLSTRYAFFIAFVLSLLLVVVLFIAGHQIFQRTGELKTQLTQTFSDTHSSHTREMLLESGTYMSQQFFNPLYNLDISRLNREINKIKQWLKPTSLFVLDQHGNIISDGTAENLLFGEKKPIPTLNNEHQPLITTDESGNVLFFSIGFNGDFIGYARIELSPSKDTVLVNKLKTELSTHWEGFKDTFIWIAIISLLIIFFTSLLLGWYLSLSLSWPLKEMGKAARNFAAGNLDYELPKVTDDEIGQLSQSMLAMVHELKASKSLIRRSEEIGGFGSWEHCENEEILNISHGIFYIFGVSENSFSPSIDHVVSMVVEKHKSHVRSIFKGHFNSTVELEFDIQTDNHQIKTLLLKGEEIRQENNKICALGTIQDITQTKKQRDIILHQAHYDALTSLPNRFLSLDRLSLMIHDARRHHRHIAVLFLDLDDFKKVNDTLGHESGDELLKQVAQRFTNTIRCEDTVGRLGGDEFIVLLNNINHISDARAVAENLLHIFDRAFNVKGRELILSVSIGIAFYPSDGDDVSEVIRNADSAMYNAKKLGRNTYSYYTAEMNRQVTRQLALEEQLHGALGRGEFSIVYQPKVDIENGNIVGAEALLRWHNPKLGHVSPDEFIPLTERNGLIIPIGSHVLNEAMAFTKTLSKTKQNAFKMAVNLSPRQFRDPTLIDNIKDIIKTHELTFDRLELEITEGVLIGASGHIKQTLSAIIDLGITMAIDDFGTGYSSLSYLRKYPFNILKIDRSFVNDITEDNDDLELVNAAISMAHALNLSVVAEGIETQEQLLLLKQSGCDLGQGYLFSKPLIGDDFIQLYTNWSPTPD